MTELKMYRDYLKKYKPLVDFIRIESGGTQCGISDIYYKSLIDGIPFNGWMELKVGYLTKEGISIKYQPKQKRFIKEHIEIGLAASTLIFYDGEFYLTQSTEDIYKNKTALFNKAVWTGELLHKGIINPYFIKGLFGLTCQ